ncbi:TOBE domain-containing protein, partial [Aestuariivirga sp.]|uniref:TOBE domain-containing protein n=1 Tax=Aestuariivirga sp. TaxID=2650926 RepID=UPI0035B0E3D2
DQEEALTMSDRIAVMSRGNILQVGSPRDIYDRPSERFVANFIGETNFLAGEVANLSAGEAHVKLPGGAVISAGFPDDLKPAGSVTVVVRPEHADLVKGEGPADLRGTLENIVYFGTDTHYYVKIDGGAEPFIIRQQNTRGGGQGFAAGDRVGIALEPHSAQVLRD